MKITIELSQADRLSLEELKKFDRLVNEFFLARAYGMNVDMKVEHSVYFLLEDAAGYWDSEGGA